MRVDEGKYLTVTVVVLAESNSMNSVNVLDWRFSPSSGTKYIIKRNKWVLHGER